MGSVNLVVRIWQLRLLLQLGSNETSGNTVMLRVTHLLYLMLDTLDKPLSFVREGAGLKCFLTPALDVRMAQSHIGVSNIFDECPIYLITAGM